AASAAATQLAATTKAKYAVPRSPRRPTASDRPSPSIALFRHGRSRVLVSVPTQHVECIWDPEVARVLGRASLAYLAVETSRGPHVTPLLFAATPDRLWFGIGRGTLKARAVAKRPAVGVVVPGENASVAIRGEATLVDRLSAPPAELV